MTAEARMDRIELTGIRARGFHGVLPAERRDGQEFVVDVALSLDLRRAGVSDELRETVNYAAVAERVVAAIEGEPLDLIEALAARIVAGCWADPQVRAVDVCVHKPSAPIPVPFGDVCVRLHRVRPRTAVVSLGANMGDPGAQLRAAARALGELPGTRLAGASAIYATEPWGRTQQPDFRNAVVLLTTDLEAEDLLLFAQRIEAQQGRTRDEHWGPRTLDIDLITVGDERVSNGLLTLPHPHAAERAFVLAPWLEVEPAAILPGMGAVADLLARLGRAGVRRTSELLLPPGAWAQVSS